MGKKSRKSKRRSKKEGSGATPTAARAKPPLMMPLRRGARAVCWICLEGGPDEGGGSLVRDCSCRGDDAGFAHLSCLVKYAAQKTRDLIDSGEPVFVTGHGSFLEPWKNCPICEYEYQRQVAVDMAKSLCAFVDERMPGDEAMKLGAYDMITYAVANDRCGKDPELRKEGKWAGNKIVSLTQQAEEGDVDMKPLQMSAYNNLASFAEADETKEGYDLALHYIEKVRGWDEERGEDTTLMDLTADRLRSKLDGTDGGDEPTLFREERLQVMRDQYARNVKDHGRDSLLALTAGISLSQYISWSRVHGLEYERMCTELAAVSNRALGPDHPVTNDIEKGLELSRWRVVVHLSRHRPVYRALRQTEDGEGYVVQGPMQDQRRPEEERVVTFAMMELRLGRGTPVVCRGLKGRTHLNGKIGDARVFHPSTRRYEVHFEESGLNPAMVKPANLRIVFDLPDKTTDASGD